MSILWSVLVPLARKAPDPSKLGQGWWGFAIFVFLAAGVVFLAFSFRKQLRKVNFDDGSKRKDTKAAEGTARAGGDEAGGDPTGDASPANGGEPS